VTSAPGEGTEVDVRVPADPNVRAQAVADEAALEGVDSPMELPVLEISHEGAIDRGSSLTP
jgi:hypothetical protein